VSTDDRDLFGELERAVQPLLSPDGRAHLDRGAGLLQVTDFPERVDAVGRYLDRVVRRAGRQVSIEARIVEVSLSDAASAGLDWQALSRLAPALQGTGGTAIRPILTTRADVERFLEGLAQQGRVTTLSHPTVVTMNNEPVIVRVDSRTRGNDAAVALASAGVVLSVTPQVGLDGQVTLSVTPSVTTASGEGGGDASTLTVRETDALLRVRDGETAVLTGWLHRAEPVLGVTPVTDAQSEPPVEPAPAPAPRLTDLVILLTPTVIDGA